MNPFDQNQPSALPDYSIPADVARDEVWQELPANPPDPGQIRNHPTMLMVSKHQAVTGAFAELGAGFVYFGLNPDRLTVGAWTANGPRAWQMASYPQHWPINIAKILADLTAAAKDGSVTQLQITFAFWDGVLNGAPDIATLFDQDRGSSVWFRIPDMAQAMSDPKLYAGIIGKVVAALSASVVGA